MDCGSQVKKKAKKKSAHKKLDTLVQGGKHIEKNGEEKVKRIMDLDKLCFTFIINSCFKRILCTPNPIFFFSFLPAHNTVFSYAKLENY